MKSISNYDLSHSKSYIAIHLVIAALFFITQYFILDYLEGLWFLLYLGILIVYLPFVVAAYVYWNFDMHVSRPIELRKWGEDKVVESETKDLTPLGQLCHKVANVYIRNKLSVMPAIIILNIWMIVIIVDIVFGRKIGGADWQGGASLPDEELKDNED